MSEFDLVVIGGGPAGYVGSIKAAQLGMKVACIEKRKFLGGTCLNVGCIPSKSLLKSSGLYESTKHHIADYGVKVKDVELDLVQMMTNKDKTLSTLAGGIDMLFKKNKITRYIGAGSIVSQNSVKIVKEDGTEEEIKTKNILIATGSEVMPLPNVVIDEEKIVSSTGALSLKSVPKKMIVIGAGVIGLELGSVWRRLGAEVEVIEFLDRICPFLDNEIAKSFQKILEKQGLKFTLSTKVTAAKSEGDIVNLEVESVKDGKKENKQADIVLVCIGRRPFTDNLGLDKVDITLDERKRIIVDSHFRTKHSNIYAIGDVINGPMLAHKAEEDGIAAAEIIAGQAGHVDYAKVPSVIYTEPEVGCVGLTEEQAKEKGLEINIGKFPFLANSRAKINGDTDGMVKIIADKKTDEIYGVHIVGPAAGDLIQEAVVAMEYRASSEDIARISHGHPGLNEAIKEAALATFFKPIHM